MSGVLLGSGHTGTIYQAHTKIPDSLKECRWSAYTILFYTNKEPFLSGNKEEESLPKSMFPDASQRPPLQAGLLRIASSGLASNIRQSSNFPMRIHFSPSI